MHGHVQTSKSHSNRLNPCRCHTCTSICEAEITDFHRATEAIRDTVGWP